MSGKNGLVLRIVLGGFLAYQGIKLIGMPAAERPDNFIPLAVCAVLFIVIGVLFAVNAVKNYVKYMKDTELQAVSYEELKEKEKAEEPESEESNLCE